MQEYRGRKMWQENEVQHVFLVGSAVIMAENAGTFFGRGCLKVFNCQAHGRRMS